MVPTGIEEGIAISVMEAREIQAINEGIIKELAINLEKNFMQKIGSIFEKVDFNPTMEDIENNKYLFRNLKSAENNPEIRRAILNSLESNCKLKGDTGEYFASKNLERIGDFERSVQHEINGRKNIIDFVCRDGLNKNESFKAIRISEDGTKIISERIYVAKGESVAVEVKNGMSEINSPKHLKEQLEAGRDLCDKSFLGINNGMVDEIINNPEKYIKKINDLRGTADEIIVLMPDIKTQIAKMGGVDLSGYNIG